MEKVDFESEETSLANQCELRYCDVLAQSYKVRKLHGKGRKLVFLM